MLLTQTLAFGLRPLAGDGLIHQNPHGRDGDQRADARGGGLGISRGQALNQLRPVNTFSMALFHAWKPLGEAGGI